jgi:hypothetical protein
VTHRLNHFAIIERQRSDKPKQCAIAALMEGL